MSARFSDESSILTRSTAAGAAWAPERSAGLSGMAASRHQAGLIVASRAPGIGVPARLRQGLSSYARTLESVAARGVKAVFSSVLVAVALLAAGSSALALDPSTVTPVERAPGEIFSLGFKAYKRGEKLEAFEALRYAAEKGHAGARWKLGQMYAQGDGVPENDFEAFKIFEEIIAEDEDDTASSPNAAYVASSVVALGDYMRTGIPGTPVSIDLPQARQLYFHAASIFGDPKAQFELGRMLLNGEGGRPNPRQAARWLKLSAEKGNTGAQALLGYLLFDGEKISLQAQPVRGLAMLTLALRHATATDESWIRPLQEEAFSLATEGDRRTALAYAEEHQSAVAKN